MPLPVENVAWPPPDVMDALKVIGEWDLWYGGDPDQLAQHYTDSDHSGVVNARSWRFWARRRPSTGGNARRERLHVPVPGDIASTSADLLFANQLALEVPGIREVSPEGSSDLTVTQDRIDEIADRGGLWNRLLEAAEECAADGGVYLRPTWDTAAADHPVLTHVNPAQAVPTFRFGILTEVTFWKTLSDPDDKTVLRHLEHHSATPSGTPTIEHALYEGTEDKVGNRIDLGAHPWTAGLPETLTIPGVTGLAVRYVPNMRPGRRLRGTPYGRSDFDGIEGLFDAIDETWNSWMRDIRLGQARLIVPRDYLERIGGNSYFDVDQELFTGLEMDPTEREGAGITDVQFKIRFQEHQATIEALVREAVGRAGYSPGSFGLDADDVAITATEVVARKDKSHQTTAKKRRYWENAVEDEVAVMLAIDRWILGRTKTKVVRPELEWPSLDAPDTHRIAETIDLLARAEAASVETLVRMQHPDWSEVDVADEVAKILDSKPQPLPNPFDLGDEEVPEEEDDAG